MSYPPDCGACIAGVLVSASILAVGGVVTAGAMDEGVIAAIAVALAEAGVVVTTASIEQAIIDAAKGKLSVENLAAQLCALGDGPCKGHV